jgi:hypothetical protein
LGNDVAAASSRRESRQGWRRLEAADTKRIGDRAMSIRLQLLSIISLSLIFLSFSSGSAWSAEATSELAPGGVSPAKKLVREFDLVPNMLSASKGGGDRAPLKTLARRMTVIHEDLSQFETDEPVQNRERKCSGLGKGNRPNGGRKASIIAKGSPAFGDLHGVDPNARQWGQLPPKLRNEILQSTTDGFPAGYEALLQSYFQQLAEEKSIDDKSTAAPSSAAAPADDKPAAAKSAPQP